MPSIVDEERMRIPPEEIRAYFAQFNRPDQRLEVPANFAEFRIKLKVVRSMIAVLKAKGRGLYLDLKSDQIAEEKFSAAGDDAVSVLNAAVYFYAEFAERKIAALLLDRITKAAAASLRKSKKRQSKK
jgi:hypothetical protein